MGVFSFIEKYIPLLAHPFKLFYQQTVFFSKDIPGNPYHFISSLP